MINGTIFAMGCMMLGALAYDIWGFLQAKKAVDATPEQERFDPVIAVVTIVPSLVMALGAGVAMNIVVPGEPLGMFALGYALVSSGFGTAAAQRKLGVNDFFRRHE